MESFKLVDGRTIYVMRRGGTLHIPSICDLVAKPKSEEIEVGTFEIVFTYPKIKDDRLSDVEVFWVEE